MKMKKFIPVFTVLCIAAAAVSGCKTKSNDGVRDKYDGLNTMLAMNYSKVVLTVENDYGEETLESIYTMSFYDGGMTVEYSVERFSEVSIDSSAQLKTAVVGEARIEGGEITYIDGEPVSLEAVTAVGGLNFKKEYFENADLTENYLIADVKDPSGFIGSEIICTDMKVKAIYLYSLNTFNSINITYKTQSGNSVKYLYKFSR